MSANDVLAMQGTVCLIILLLLHYNFFLSLGAIFSFRNFSHQSLFAVVFCCCLIFPLVVVAV